MLISNWDYIPSQGGNAQDYHTPWDNFLELTCFYNGRVHTPIEIRLYGNITTSPEEFPS